MTDETPVFYFVFITYKDGNIDYQQYLDADTAMIAACKINTSKENDNSILDVKYAASNKEDFPEIVTKNYKEKMGEMNDKLMAYKRKGIRKLVTNK